MKILRKIQRLSEEKLEEYVERRINLLEAKSKKNHKYPLTLGYDVENINPMPYDFINEYDKLNMPVKSICSYRGYIPKGDKMIYEYKQEPPYTLSNKGGYYIIDDDSYILEFCKYIRNEDIANEHELFNIIGEFLDLYFGDNMEMSRNEMNRLIYKNDNSFFEPIREHKFSDFFGKGNAKCSEFAIAAQNIMSFFGYDPYCICGRLDYSDRKSERDHVFNIVNYTEERTGKTTRIIFDASASVNIFDYVRGYIGRYPYISFLEESMDEIFYKLFAEDNGLELESYSYEIIGNRMMQAIHEEITRRYSIKIDFELSKVMTKER